jgi:Flp pilus assembly protein TadD
VTAELQLTLATALVFSGHLQEAVEPFEQALTLAQQYELTDTLVRGLGNKGIWLGNVGRVEEARLNHEGSLDIARRHGLTRIEMNGEGNLGDLCMTRDLPGAEEHCQAVLALARRWGARAAEASNLMYVLTMAGRFEEAFTTLCHAHELSNTAPARK